MISQTPRVLPLDPTAYNLKGDDLAFFKKNTGIQDEDELREHILAVQAEGYAVHPYPCIRSFVSLVLKISKYPIYQDVLKLGKERPGAILLDLGCCFGYDARKAIADGYPRDNVITSDLHPEFWTLGHKLFKTTQETYPVPFLAGDIFDPSFLSPDASPAHRSSHPLPAPPLPTLTSLTPLQHRISVIHTSALFHLFSESKQRELAQLLGTLLSPVPGSIIFGSDMGVPDAESNGPGRGGSRVSGHGIRKFAHSPSSWEKMWAGEGGVFKPEDVNLWARTQEIERKVIVEVGLDPTYKSHVLVWSVTRA